MNAGMFSLTTLVFAAGACLGVSMAHGQTAVHPEAGGPGAGAPPGVPPAMVRYDGHKVVRVTVTTPRELLVATTLAESVWSEGSGIGTFDIQLSPKGYEQLVKEGLPHRVLIADLQALTDAQFAEIERLRQLRDTAWFQNYHTLAEIHAYIDQLAAAYPQLASSFVVGTSLEGRQIKGLRVTGPGDTSNRSAAFYNGGQHAREWVSPATVMYIGEKLLTGYGSDVRITSLVNNCEFLLVPVCNPDGYVYTWSTDRYWRKNRRNNGNGSYGVDMNRNWGYQWGGQGASTNPGDETYRGPSAFSEPETQALRDFITTRPRIRTTLDFHSYSQLILSPWAYTSALPPDQPTFALLNGRIQSAIASVNGLVYTAGPTYTTIYPASGAATDWCYGARGALGLSIELRDTGTYGFALPPAQIIPTGEENFAGILPLSEYVAYPVEFSFPGGVPTRLVAGQSNTLTVNIANTSGILNASTALLSYKTISNSAYVSVPLTPVSGSLYQATIPAQACNDVVTFYLTASGTDGRVATAPVGAPGAAYTATVSATRVKFDDQCETNTGWTVGAPGDTATTGIWGLMDPQGTTAQPEDDHSPNGTNCWVTDGRSGATSGTYDVDGGATTLTSPAMDARTPADIVFGEAFVTYSRWYSNDKGSNPNSDSMPVLISADNGATWTTLETVTENANAWVTKTFRVADFVTPSATVKLRFVARDLGGGSTVEAAVDDVKLEVFGCDRNPADFDGNGFVDFDDFNLFVQAFEAGDLSADFDNSGFVDFDDFNLYVVAFENG